MQLLRELMRVQHEEGWISDECLRMIAKARRTPLYRLEELVSFYPHFRRTPPPRAIVRICRDAVCRMAGCEKQWRLTKNLLQDVEDVEIQRVSCLGRCDHAPAISVNDTPCSLDSIDELAGQLRSLSMGGTSFLPRPRHNRREPWKCDPYPSAEDRYGTVRRLWTSDRPQNETAQWCVQQLQAAGLRGMGGAGFPTGKKWDSVRNCAASPKFVICNADESEPGTFKDRVILDELSHLVIEGMVFAGLTVGAEQGIIYLRHEYAPEQSCMENALADAQQRGILGANAAGSGKQFDIEIFVSPGGYIMGEETALLEALEDRRGEPRTKPPYPSTHGLHGRPTLINNVETFALATSILTQGVDWWTKQGKRGSRGRKFVSVSGDVQQPDVYDIPLGTTVSELIELAGGMAAGCKLQAFLPGGASSNFLLADKADTPIDFESLKAAGSMLGSGAVVVIGDQHSLFDLALNLVRFFRNESCGKCVPCRMGTEKAVQLLESVHAGTPDSDLLNIVRQLAKTMEQTSICGLGQVALNPIVSLYIK